MQCVCSTARARRQRNDVGHLLLCVFVLSSQRGRGYVLRTSRSVGSGAVAAAATGCCTTALLTERLLRAVDDGVHRPSPPDTRPVGVWVAAPLVSPWSERMNAMWRSSL